MNNEKAVLKKLKENYQDALFEINDRLERLLGRQDADMQNVIYQVEYQKALKTQVQGILDQLQANEFETVSDYLAKAYENGFVGTMYDIAGQGIPLIIPINQEQVVAAIQHETKLSDGLYAALGKDTKRLSKQIASEISRGISNAATYEEMTRNIASFSNIPRNNAARIARTEAHRIQCKATMDAQWKAKEKGADIVKQWDSTMDGKTRESHRKLDGQIRELDEDFEVDGMHVSAPSQFWDPAEDCNCRCTLLQRARWALDEDELATLKDRAEYFELDKANDFDDFKEKYLNGSSVYDLLFKEKADSTLSAKQKYENMLEVVDSYTNMPIKVKQKLSDVEFEFGYDKNACDIANKVIRVGIDTTKEKIDHEYGHLIENYMMNKNEVDDYKKFLTEGLSISDIISDTYEDDAGNLYKVYLLKGNRFETEYQSRLYVLNPLGALNPDGTINIDVLGECISEPFSKYMNNEPISDEARKLIEGAVL